MSVLLDKLILTKMNKFFVLKGDLGNIVTQFAYDNDYFLQQYDMAYNYLMTADLFDGPTNNACEGVNDPTLMGDLVTSLLLLLLLLLLSVGSLHQKYCSKKHRMDSIDSNEMIDDACTPIKNTNILNRTDPSRIS
jgi:hypothetical protein